MYFLEYTWKDAVNYLMNLNQLNRKSHGSRVTVNNVELDVKKHNQNKSKTIIASDGDSSAIGANVFFYDSAEGLLTATISENELYA